MSNPNNNSFCLFALIDDNSSHQSIKNYLYSFFSSLQFLTDIKKRVSGETFKNQNFGNNQKSHMPDGDIYFIFHIDPAQQCESPPKQLQSLVDKTLRLFREYTLPS